MAIAEYCWQQMGGNSQLSHSNLSLTNTDTGMQAEWLDSNSIHSPAIIRKKWKGTNKEKALKWLSRYVIPHSDTALMWRRILDLYRNSGLMPKAVAQDHAKMLRDWFGDNYKTNKRAAAFVTCISWKYISDFARCPKCGCHECWEEEVFGVRCKNCSAAWIDIESPAKWSKVE